MSQQGRMLTMFAMVLAFTLVFRINLSYARWWESRKSADQFAACWLSAAAHACVYDQFSVVSAKSRYVLLRCDMEAGFGVCVTSHVG